MATHPNRSSAFVIPVGILYWIGVFFLSFVFAFALASFQSDLIIDRANYITHVTAASVRLLVYLSESVVAFLSNEPIWRILNFVLGLFFEPVTAVSAYIFFSAFLVSYSALNYNRKFFLLLLLFLLLPQFLKNYIVHLRQGFAIALFVYAWLRLSGKSRVFVLVLTPFIHSSFFFVLFLVGFQQVVERLRLSMGVKFSLLALVAVVIGGFSLQLAGALGARQDYELGGDRVSGLGFIFWSVILAIYLSQGRSFLKKNFLGVGALVFYLSVYFYLPLAGRIFESLIIFTLLASLDLKGVRFLAFLGFYAFYFIFQWYFRLGVEGFGWIG